MKNILRPPAPQRPMPEPDPQHSSLMKGNPIAAKTAWWRPLLLGKQRLLMLSALVAFFLIVVLVVALVEGASPRASTSSIPQTITVPAHQPYNAQPQIALSGNTVDVHLTVTEKLLAIASGTAYHAWTFGGTVPGPIVRVRQGQTVNFTLTNNGTIAHSIDFHAAQVPWDKDYQPILPGKSLSFSFQANYPGVFMYHCGTPTVMHHMANGMYGAIIVDPAGGWSPAQEYVLVQSEFYTLKQPDGSYALDPQSVMSGMPNLVVFNGYANQYKDAPLTAKAGQRIRFFIVDAGPNLFSAFHVIGAIFSDYYPDGNPANHLVGNQTITVPPGGGAVVELTIPDPGLYPFVTHSFADASNGALGVLKVTP